MVRRAKKQISLDVELERAAAFRTELRRFLRRTDVVTAEAGLTPQRYDLLLMIRSAGGGAAEVRLTKLCDLLQMRQTAVTELVNRTEDAGLIERQRSDEDGRVWLLALTAEGEHRLLHAFRALRNDRVALTNAFRQMTARFEAASK